MNTRLNDISAGDIRRSMNGGEFKVVEVISYSSKGITIQFLDKYKYSIKVNAGEVRSGKIKNPYATTVYGVGFIGEGSIVGKKNTAYLRWVKLLGRCYSDSPSISYITYDSCEVSDDWKNFRNFERWFNLQKKPTRSYCVDKDLFSKGKSLYSVETCCILPNEINVAIQGRERGRTDKYPCGVYCSTARGNFVSKITKFNKSFHIGTFTSHQSAWEAYKMEKVKYLKELAYKHKEDLTIEVFAALLEFEPTMFDEHYLLKDAL